MAAPVFEPVSASATPATGLLLVSSTRPATVWKSEVPTKLAVLSPSRFVKDCEGALNVWRALDTATVKLRPKARFGSV